jgi:hypothetical protein
MLKIQRETVGHSHFPCSTIHRRKLVPYQSIPMLNTLPFPYGIYEIVKFWCDLFASIKNETVRQDPDSKICLLIGLKIVWYLLSVLIKISSNIQRIWQFKINIQGMYFEHFVWRSLSLQNFLSDCPRFNRRSQVPSRTLCQTVKR